MKEQRSQSIILLGRHHQVRFANIERCLYGLTASQSLVEADAEPDRGPVSHGLPHADNPWDDHSQCPGKPLRPARVDDDTLHVLADRLECLYQPIHRDDVCVPDVILGRETPLLTATMAGEVDEVRLEVDESLNDVAGTYRPLSFDHDFVSFPTLLDGLLDLADLFVDTKRPGASRIGTEKEDPYERTRLLCRPGTFRRIAAHAHGSSNGALVASIRPAVNESKMDGHLSTCLLGTDEK